ncbi:hypothetical protein BN970_02381 [Mycolicibacterium conceptionense]|uniref:Uncharacterized protein n=1 Tax=Mycolicibacterium conceptionense TaxID=451644 RepID=A0A0U1DB40_9MYCO|nr:hypothetical protein BN970_02381 [Mycolicibacterium conceptionense]
MVLRCGLERPADFVVGTPLQVVDEVQWFRVGEAGPAADDQGRSTWYAVDRPVYVALTLPAGPGRHPFSRSPARSPARWRPGAGTGTAALKVQRKPVPRASAVSTIAVSKVG